MIKVGPRHDCTNNFSNIIYDQWVSVRISIMPIPAVSGVWDRIKCIALKQGNRVSNSPDNQRSPAALNWDLINCKNWRNVIFSFLGKASICVGGWGHAAPSRWGKGGQPELFNPPRARRMAVDHLLWKTPHLLPVPMWWSLMSPPNNTAVNWAARQVTTKRDYEEM